MKRLKVKRYKQGVGSLDCGPVSVRMILEYFGIHQTEKNLKKGMLYTKLGTYMFNQGLQLLKEGLRTKIITANPLLFAGVDRKKLKNKNAVRKHLKWLRTSRDKELKPFQKGITLFIKYLDAGGDVEVVIPEFAHIKRAIDAGNLVMPNVYMNALGTAGRNAFYFHTFVINGYSKDNVYFVDPYPKVKTNHVSIKDFTYALYTATCVDIDNGSLLIVSKK